MPSVRSTSRGRSQESVPADPRGPLRVTEVAAGGPGPGLRVVAVAGLGAPSSLRPTVLELGRRGVWTSLLDAPGFGAPGPLACAPTISGLAGVVARYVRGLPAGCPVVLFGHSTAAVVALRAALEVQDDIGSLAVVLAAPVFVPEQRTLPAAALAAVLAARRDSPRELVALREYWRGRRHLPALVRSGLLQRPEDLVGSLSVPVTLTAGVADTLAPHRWLVDLAARAVRAPWVDVVELPGSHDNPFTHPGEVAGLVLGAWRATASTPVVETGPVDRGRR